LPPIAAAISPQAQGIGVIREAGRVARVQVPGGDVTSGLNDREIFRDSEGDIYQFRRDEQGNGFSVPLTIGADGSYAIDTSMVDVDTIGDIIATDEEMRTNLRTSVPAAAPEQAELDQLDRSIAAVNAAANLNDAERRAKLRELYRRQGGLLQSALSGAGAAAEAEAKQRGRDLLAKVPDGKGGFIDVVMVGSRPVPIEQWKADIAAAKAKANATAADGPAKLDAERSKFITSMVQAQVKSLDGGATPEDIDAMIESAGEAFDRIRAATTPAAPAPEPTLEAERTATPTFTREGIARDIAGPQAGVIPQIPRPPRPGAIATPEVAQTIVRAVIQAFPNLSDEEIEAKAEQWARDAPGGGWTIP
jgi:hypothetical protein